LRAALQGRPGVAGVRGLGLLLAVELDVDARAVAADLLADGVVVNAVTPTALRLAPSLLITDDELDLAATAVSAAVARALEAREAT
jgi:acetylornithine aminotransferase